MFKTSILVFRPSSQIIQKRKYVYVDVYISIFESDFKLFSYFYQSLILYTYVLVYLIKKKYHPFFMLYKGEMT